MSYPLLHKQFILTDQYVKLEVHLSRNKDTILMLHSCLLFGHHSVTASELAHHCSLQLFILKKLKYIKDNLWEVENSLYQDELSVIENSFWAMGCSHCGKIKSNHHSMESGGAGGSICGAIICAICSSSFGNDDGIFWYSHHSTGAKLAADTTSSRAARVVLHTKGVRIQAASVVFELAHWECQLEEFQQLHCWGQCFEADSWDGCITVLCWYACQAVTDGKLYDTMGTPVKSRRQEIICCFSTDNLLARVHVGKRQNILQCLYFKKKSVFFINNCSKELNFFMIPFDLESWGLQVSNNVLHLYAQSHFWFGHFLPRLFFPPFLLLIWEKGS